MPSLLNVFATDQFFVLGLYITLPNRPRNLERVSDSCIGVPAKPCNCPQFHRIYRSKSSPRMENVVPNSDPLDITKDEGSSDRSVRIWVRKRNVV